MISQATVVTIGVPVYNGATMVGDMLASLEAQTFKRFKVVICDNASTDKTPEIAQAFCARDPRFTYHRNPENIGAAPNFNRVWKIDHSTPYYKWAAHDDLYAPTYLERCVEVLERTPEAAVAFPMTVMVDDTRQGHAAAFMLLEDGIIDSFTDDEGRPAWTIGPLHLAEAADPVQRLDEFLNKTIGSFEIFGVMRTAVVEKTQLHASYYGSDRALLAQLLLRGPFRHVPERLYVNRFHQAASRLMSREEQRNWIDTRGGSRLFSLRKHWDIFLCTDHCRVLTGRSRPLYDPHGSTSAPDAERSSQMQACQAGGNVALSRWRRFRQRQRAGPSYRLSEIAGGSSGEMMGSARTKIETPRDLCSPCMAIT